MIVRGKLVTRGTAKFADYVLYYKPNLPIAVLEAKDASHGVGDGMQQALGYAEMLEVPFVFSSNGDGFLFHDRTGAASKVEETLATHHFPTPEELASEHLAQDLRELRLDRRPAFARAHRGGVVGVEVALGERGDERRVDDVWRRAKARDANLRRDCVQGDVGLVRRQRAGTLRERLEVLAQERARKRVPHHAPEPREVVAVEQRLVGSPEEKRDVDALDLLRVGREAHDAEPELLRHCHTSRTMASRRSRRQRGPLGVEVAGSSGPRVFGRPGYDPPMTTLLEALDLDGTWGSAPYATEA